MTTIPHGKLLLKALLSREKKFIKCRLIFDPFLLLMAQSRIFYVEHSSPHPIFFIFEKKVNRRGGRRGCLIDKQNTGLIKKREKYLPSLSHTL